jgi:hypothetical protein
MDTTEQDLKGITAMATVASNLTLASVLATLHTLQVSDPDELQERYNKGVKDCIDVIRVYTSVLTAEQAKRNG